MQPGAPLKATVSGKCVSLVQWPEETPAGFRYGFDLPACFREKGHCRGHYVVQGRVGKRLGRAFSLIVADLRVHRQAQPARKAVLRCRRARLEESGLMRRSQEKDGPLFEEPIEHLQYAVEDVSQFSSAEGQLCVCALPQPGNQAPGRVYGERSLGWVDVGHNGVYEGNKRRSRRIFVGCVSAGHTIAGQP